MAWNDKKMHLFFLLPTAYVVRREGNVFTRVCPSIHLSVHRGGTPPDQVGGGYPSQVQPGGTPARSSWGLPHLARGVPQSGSAWGGGTPARSRQGGTPASRCPPGVPQPGQDGGYLSQGVPTPGYPPGQVRMRGTQSAPPGQDSTCSTW